MSPRDYLIGLSMGLCIGAWIAADHLVAVFVSACAACAIALVIFAFDVRRSRGTKGH